MVNTLVFTLVGRDQLSKVFDAAGRSADRAGGKIGASGKVIRGGMALMLAGGVAAATGIGSALKQAIPFDKTMRKVGAISGATGNDLKGLSALAIQMGKDTVFGAGDAAQAMLELSKGGITPAQIKAGVLAGTLTLATAGELQMGDAATYLSNSLNTFGLKATDSNRVVAALAGGANASSASVESLGLALGQVGPGAKLAGMSLEETVAVLAAFDNAGVKGSDAGTSLKTMLMRLVPSTDEAAGAMEELGLKFTDAKGNIMPLRDIAGQLQAKLKGLTVEQKQAALTTIFGSDAYRAAAIMSELGAAGVDKYTKATTDLDAAQKLAAVGVEGAAGAWEQLKGSVETLAIEQGQKLLPAFTAVALFANTRVVPAVGKMSDKFGSFLGGMRRDVGPSLGVFAELVKTDVIPAAQDLGGRVLGQLRDGWVKITGAVKEHEPELRKLGESALALAGWLGTNLQPPVAWLGEHGIPMLGSAIAGTIDLVGDITGAIQSHTTTAKILAGLIATVFIPHWVAVGVAAAISGGQQAVAWAVNSTAGIRGAAVHSVNVVRTVAGWVAMGGAAVVSGAETAFVWGLYQTAAIKGAAAHVAASGRVVGGWVLMSAASVAAGVRTVGAWVLMGTQSLIHAARMAAAWLIAMGPVGWVILGLGLVGLAFVALWKKSETFRTIVTGVWDGIKTVTMTAISFIVKQFLGFAGSIVGAATKAFGWVPGIGPKLKTANDEFKKFADDVNAKLDSINDEPVNIKVDLAYTAALGAKTKQMSFATGGMMPGYTPGRDVHRFYSATGGILDLSGGEPVLRPEAGAVLGKDWVDGINSAARGGGKSAVQRFLGAFAGGGVIMKSLLPSSKRVQAMANAAAGDVSHTGDVMAKAIAKAMVAAQVNPGLAGVLSWVKTQVGKPYGWGAAGPGAYDCSGLVGAAINKAFGRNPHRRLGATGSMPWSMFAPGPGAFEVGWFQGNPGHTAATVNRTNIESAGGVGVRMGAGARGSRNKLFTRWMHVKGFAGGGIFGDGRDGDAPYDLLRDKALRKMLGFKVFDDGGMLMPGEFGFNSSRHPEPVLKGGAEIIDYEKLADVLVQAIQKGRPVNVEQNFPTSADPKAAAEAGARRLVSLLGDI